jgi:hypothetical protein
VRLDVATTVKIGTNCPPCCKPGGGRGTVTVPCCPTPVPLDMVASFDSACACLDGAELPVTYTGTTNGTNLRGHTGSYTSYNWASTASPPVLCDEVIVKSVTLSCVHYSDDDTHEWLFGMRLHHIVVGVGETLCVNLTYLNTNPTITAVCSPFEVEVSDTLTTAFLNIVCPDAAAACGDLSYTCTFLPA